MGPSENPSVHTLHSFTQRSSGTTPADGIPSHHHTVDHLDSQVGMPAIVDPIWTGSVDDMMMATGEGNRVHDIHQMQVPGDALPGAGFSTWSVGDERADHSMMRNIHAKLPVVVAFGARRLMYPARSLLDLFLDAKHSSDSHRKLHCCLVMETYK